MAGERIDEHAELGVRAYWQIFLKMAKRPRLVRLHVVQLEQQGGARGGALGARDRGGDELIHARAASAAGSLGEAADDEDRSLKILVRGVGEELGAVGHDLGHRVRELASLEQCAAILGKSARGVADQLAHHLSDGDDRIRLPGLHQHAGGHFFLAFLGGGLLRMP